MLQAEFFDIFGAIGFIYISALSILFLKKKSVPKWSVVVLLLIGLGGLIVDSLVVYFSFIR